MLKVRRNKRYCSNPNIQIRCNLVTCHGLLETVYICSIVINPKSSNLRCVAYLLAVAGNTSSRPDPDCCRIEDYLYWLRIQNLEPHKAV